MSGNTMNGLDIFTSQFDIRKEAVATHHALLMTGKEYFPTVSQWT